MVSSSRRGMLAGLSGSVVASMAPGRARAASRKIGYAIMGLGSYATRQIMPRSRPPYCSNRRMIGRRR